MHVLTVDVETSPNICYSFQLWKTNIPADHIIEPSRIICWAARWDGEKKVMFRSEFHDGREKMVSELWKLFNEADVVVGYNSERFDVPKINTAFKLLGLNPPAPFKQVDLIKTARKVFDFASNKLGYITVELGLGKKESHEGFDLWVKCLNGDIAAWKKMRKYNRQDVVITEELFHSLLPWIAGLPSYGAFTGEDVCPSCGADEFLIKDGFAYTQSGKFQAWHCKPKRGGCGRYSRSTKRISGTGIVPIAAAG